jgi:hypothetical protein
MKKKLIVLTLALILSFSITTVTFAADIDDPIGHAVTPIVITK